MAEIDLRRFATTQRVSERLDLEPAGALLWWRFCSSYTPPELLAASALQHGFPTLYLPVPFPISPSNAFSRALRHAMADLGPDWRFDTIHRDPRAMAGVPPPVLADIPRGRALVAEVEQWAAAGSPLSVPWREGLWIVMDRDSDMSLPAEALLVAHRRTTLVDERDTGTHIRIDPADSSSTPDDPGLIATQAIIRHFRNEQQLCAGTEIGNGVQAALEHHGGVKIMPGLWSVPGRTGVMMSRSAEAYLDSAGGTRAGRMLLVNEAPDEIGLIRLALEAEIRDLERQVEEAIGRLAGIGAMRTLAMRVDLLNHRIGLNRLLLGSQAGELLRATVNVNNALEGAIRPRTDLRASAGARQKALRRLETELRRIREAAGAHSPEDIRTATQAEEINQAGRRLGISHLTQRVVRLVDAAAHVDHPAMYRALVAAAAALSSSAEAHGGTPLEPDSPTDLLPLSQRDELDPARPER
jgi:hypothetical protein